MVTNFIQEAIGIFASDEAAVKESPGAEYDNGVRVQYTAPGKWWNWLWNKITGWFNASLSDKQIIVTEMSNVLSDAVITPDATDSTQLAKGIGVIIYRHARQHDEATVTEGGVERPVNKPYVSGSIIVLPDTELL